MRAVHHPNQEALPCSTTRLLELGSPEPEVRSPATRNPAIGRTRLLLNLILILACAAATAADDSEQRHVAPNTCATAALHEHVREQFAEFAPQSTHREYFGLIYLFDGRLASAVVRGKECRRSDRCVIDITSAARSIPRGARLLGEWHTHPRMGSHELSADDVRGARRFRRIPCYQAFYSTPLGEMYSWDVAQTSVPAAMATRVHLGKLPDPAMVAFNGGRSR